MKFKREKQKLVIGLNAKEEKYLKEIVGTWLGAIIDPEEETFFRKRLAQYFCQFLMGEKKQQEEYEI